MTTTISVYGVPGQPHYRATRKAVLAGVDGIVFVADSQNHRRDDNLEAFADLKALLIEYNYDYERIPVALQFNKRDLDDLTSVAEMNSMLNDRVHPFYEASAINGEGVVETFRAITKLVTSRLTEDFARR
jgi:signal recognition particle receptor subunit beta